ncbi:hypothetical protein Emag_003071 [Eimeria magna]
MKASSTKATRPGTPSSRSMPRSSTSPTSRSASEAPSLRGRRVLSGPSSSDSSVVLGILQNIAKQTVEQAIVQHHQRGGKAVSGARVRITPGGSLRIGQEEAGKTAIPQVVQEFAVFPSQEGNGNEVRAVTPAARFLDPNFRAAYETSPCVSRFPSTDDIYGLTTADGQAPSWNESLGRSFCLPPHMAAAHASLPCQAAPPLPRPHSTCCLPGRTCRSSSDLQGRGPASTSKAACCRFRSAFGSASAQPCCAAYDTLPAVSPSCCEGHVPAAPAPVGIDASPFADQLMQSFSGSARLKNLPPDIKGLIKDILKLWATKACYEGAARAVKAWMTRRRCSYSEEATEEVALREVPQQYEKYRNLGRATEKLQRQLEAKLSSTILQPTPQQDTSDAEQQPSATQAARTSEDCRLLQLKLHQFDAALKAITKTCNRLAAEHKDDAESKSRGEAACGAAERARSQEICEERDYLSARLVAQQEMLRQLSKVNQRQIAELVRLKGRHRALCRITPGVESLRWSSTSADVPSVFVKAQGISTLLVKSQPVVRQQAKSRAYSPQSKTRMFEFDHVYDEKTTTHDIYVELKELTASVLAGNIL